MCQTAARHFEEYAKTISKQSHRSDNYGNVYNAGDKHSNDEDSDNSRNNKQTTDNSGSSSGHSSGSHKNTRKNSSSGISSGNRSGINSSFSSGISSGSSRNALGNTLQPAANIEQPPVESRADKTKRLKDLAKMNEPARQARIEAERELLPNYGIPLDHQPQLSPTSTFPDGAVTAIKTELLLLEYEVNYTATNPSGACFFTSILASLKRNFTGYDAKELRRLFGEYIRRVTADSSLVNHVFYMNQITLLAQEWQPPEALRSSYEINPTETYLNELITNEGTYIDGFFGTQVISDMLEIDVYRLFIDIDIDTENLYAPTWNRISPFQNGAYTTNERPTHPNSAILIWCNTIDARHYDTAM
jgi:hypothetical protein